MYDIDIEKFRNITFEKRRVCEICKEPLNTPLIQLPEFPMTEIYTRKKINRKIGFVNQYFHYCNNCGQGQLENVLDISLQYGNSIIYHFRTSQSASGRESTSFFLKFLKRVIKEKNFGTVVELGSNDLFLLKSLKGKGIKLIGIDPLLKGKEEEFSEDNIIAIGDYFENIRLEEDIDLVICKDTLEHVAKPREFVEKIVKKSHKKTLFIFQFPILETLLDGCRFDQIFHQHLNYFSLKSINYMLEKLGCELLDNDINYNHWGGILIAFIKSNNKSKYKKKVREITNEEILEKYSVFKKNLYITKKRLEYLKDKKTYGYGAALMLPVLAYHMKTDFSFLECIIDDDKDKEDLFYINLPVTIKTRESIGNINGTNILLTAIASKYNIRAITSKLIKLNPMNIILPINVI